MVKLVYFGAIRLFMRVLDWNVHAFLSMIFFLSALLNRSEKCAFLGSFMSVRLYSSKFKTFLVHFCNQKKYACYSDFVRHRL